MSEEEPKSWEQIVRENPEEHFEKEALDLIGIDACIAVQKGMKKDMNKQRWMCEEIHLNIMDGEGPNGPYSIYVGIEQVSE